LKKLIAIILLLATLLTAFSITAFADDNATGGDGDTQGAASGYGWYNTYQFLWKVSLYVGKSDQASKSSNLSSDFYDLGTVIIKRTGWTVGSSVQFGSGTKVDYYSGAGMSSYTGATVISEASCPAVPIACDGNIETVKSYFGSTGTMSLILNGIASQSGTSAYGLVSGKTFTIGGQTKSGWQESYIMPNGTSNRIPWVIIYEPMVIMNCKDKVTKVAFTATEFAISEKNGWFDWHYSGGTGQAVSKLTHQHLPTSVQLEESWFGYPVYGVTNDSQSWSNDDIIKGGGWGMRWLPVSVYEPTYTPEIDYGVTFGSVDSSPAANSYGNVTVNWRNYKSQSGTVLCELYKGSSLVWSGYKSFSGNQTITQSYSVYYSGTSSQTLTAKINYADRYSETDPNDNIATRTITPTGGGTIAPSGTDYGCGFGFAPTVEANTYGSVTVTWRNWTNAAGSVLCELYKDGSVIWSGYKYFTGNAMITESYNVYFGGTATANLTARINYANRYSETDPNDNIDTMSVTPAQTTDMTYDFSVSNLVVSPSSLYQGNYCTVSFRSDNWNRDLAFYSVPVEVLVGGTVVKTEYVSFSAYGMNYHTYSIYMGDYGNQTVTARINWNSRYYESNAYNNSIATSVNVQKYYEFSVSNLSVTPSTVYENDSVTITFRTDNWDRYNAYYSVPVEVLYNGTVVSTEYVNYPAYGGKNHTVTLNVGSTVETNPITVRVNWQNHYSEVNPNNNQTATAYVTVKPKIDLTIQPISPNSDYRAGMTVITSYRIYNNCRHNIIPSHNNTVSFEVYYYNGSSKVTVTNQAWSQAVVPGWGSNLVYFKWTVPQAAVGKTVYCVAKVNSTLSVDEYNITNNTATLTRTVASVPTSQTLDTHYEKQKPSGYTIPSTPQTQNGTATWSMWEYVYGSFVQRNYGIAISTANPSVTPDSDSPSKQYSGGVWKMRSGYGITMSYNPYLTSVSGYTIPSSSAYTAVQRASASFPEFRYSSSVNQYRTLEKSGSGFCFIQNSDADGNERLHFTPLWYPNGSYTVSVTATDCWTPAGMIQTIRNSNAVTIVDAAYDDWYIGR